MKKLISIMGLLSISVFANASASLNCSLEAGPGGYYGDSPNTKVYSIPFNKESNAYETDVKLGAKYTPYITVEGDTIIVELSVSNESEEGMISTNDPSVTSYSKISKLTSGESIDLMVFRNGRSVDSEVVVISCGKK